MLVFSAGRASARGTVRVHNPNPKEDDGEWKLKFTINYGRMPDLPHVPMMFSFKPTAVYQRSLTDASPDKPIMTRKPIVNGTPINLPMDVGFSDMTGKMFKITKFGMTLTRDADFVAGEYTLTVRLTSGGHIGGPQHIRLKGNNKVIDRRAMVFTAKAPEKKPKDDKPAPGEDADSSEPHAAEDMGPDLSDIPDVPDDGSDPDAPPAVPPKQGGCGCEAVGRGAPGAGVWLAALGLGLVVSRRRLRRSGARA